ncbi:MAG: aminopeptidase P family protein [Rhodothermales bacterium]
MIQRLDALRAHFSERHADAAILTFLPDIRWACGFSGSNGLLLVTQQDAHFITDGRYTEQAGREVAGAAVHIAEKGLFDALASRSLLAGVGRVIIQSDHLTLDAFDDLQEAFPDVEWAPAKGLLKKDVAVKAKAEIDAMQRAQDVTDAVFDELLGVIRPGMTELEVAAEIVYRHMRRGASGMSFDPIVAAGPNGALPHARPTDRRLAPGDLVVLDFGCFVDGYASDMTRTIAIGEPDPEAVKVYHIVLDAHLKALDAARAGMSGKALDAVARTLIADAGYGPLFSHSLGHGVGLQIHEWPSVSFRTEDELPAGVVITIEPGIYVPGRFGVRIEDMALLEAHGARSMAHSPKELIQLGNA